MKNLEKIFEKYKQLAYNENNFDIGGGLVGDKFASNRHEDALSDPAKLTLGKAVQMFKKATGLETEEVKAIIKYATPNMEWHHAGKLPKAYGGGMKKTYFLNSTEICSLAVNFHEFKEKHELSQAEKRRKEEEKRNIEGEKTAFLLEHAEKIDRKLRSQIENNLLFHQTKREMQGKYGWFDSSYKSYNLPEYFSGWQFKNEKDYEEFLNIK